MNRGRVHKWAQAYFNWLVGQVNPDTDPPRTYFDLFRLMHSKEFIWLDPHVKDENRIEDGRDLRLEFLHENTPEEELHEADFGPISFLEVLIGISRRLAFAAGGEAPGWAWQLVINLEMAEFTDPVSHRQLDKANGMIDCVIWRQFNPDGSGGFFPLGNPDEDQTQVEIWYQMNAYIDEMER